MLTVLEIIQRTTEYLAGRGVESPRLNAELLIGHTLGLKRMQLYLEFERPLTETELGVLRPLVRRRGQREPLQYIVGHTEFAGVGLKVDRRALIPRPETERLVELVLEWAGRNPPVARVLDLGAGSGAIALALARGLPGVEVVAAERSPEALELARENAQAAGLTERVSLVLSDWFAAVPTGPFDVVASNPPYLTAEETAATAPEVRDHEPQAALLGGTDGLRDLRVLIEAAPRFLRRGGLLALETGISQHPVLLPQLREAGYSVAESRTDLTGRDRFILAVW